MTNPAVEQYWENFIRSVLPGSPYRDRTYIAERLGDNPALADELGQLVLGGFKSARSSALWQWEAEGKLLPQPGQMTVLLDGKDQPLCIIETTQVWVCRFNMVDEEFADAEGEGDHSLEYWRDAHARYFSRALPGINKQFSEEMPVVCERFKVVYG
jgi:uncharacterized protein YhfF